MKIGVMGNIGVGKTTLCGILKSWFDEHGLDFDVEYEKQDESPYMEDYYKDMKRWAFSSQIYFLRRKFETDLKISKSNKNCIIDRIIDEDVYVFASMMHDMNYIDDRDWQNYLDVFELMKSHVSKYDLVIYLYMPFEKAAMNIINRGREYERSISIQYLSTLENKYNELAEKLKSENVKIIKIDKTDMDFKKPEDYKILFENLMQVDGIFKNETSQK